MQFYSILSRRFFFQLLLSQLYKRCLNSDCEDKFCFIMDVIPQPHEFANADLYNYTVNQRRYNQTTKKWVIINLRQYDGLIGEEPYHIYHILKELVRNL